MRAAYVVVVAVAACGRVHFAALDDAAPDNNDATVDASSVCAFRSITAGEAATCGIDANGAVWCWGSNAFGELVPGTSGTILMPVRVPLARPAVQVHLGRDSLCARTDDGNVWCQGAAGQGQLGNGSTVDQPALVQVDLAGDTALDVEVGARFACAIRASDRAVVCWGNNDHDQAGAAVGSTQLVPTALPGTAGTKQISLGHNHSCGIDAQDRGFCWGRGDVYQLGNGVASNSSSTVLVGGLTGSPSAVVAGSRYSCAIDATSDVRCWGDATHFRQSVSMSPGGAIASNAAELALTALGGCARETDGTVTCWGATPVDGITNTWSGARASQVLSGVTQLAGVWRHTCAIAGSDTLCWGSNGGGELGRGTRSASPTPLAVTTGLSSISAVSVGGFHQVVCALAAGRVYCWGSNYAGQLGTGPSADATAPIEVATGLSTAEGVSVGGSLACAWGGGGARCWGMNDVGQLGTGTTSSVPSTPATAGLTQVVTLSAGDQHACAITGSGTTIQCWGRNANGQLGNTLTADSASAVTVTGVVAPVKLSLGGNTTCAIGSGGLSCWGANDSGQIGDGSTTDRSSPTPITIPGGPSDVAVGFTHACAINASGVVYCWGNIDFADGLHTSPTAVPLPAAADRLTSGYQGACARLVTGVVMCWGRGRSGANADGTYNESTPMPQAITSLAAASSVSRAVDSGCGVVGGQLLCWGLAASLTDPDVLGVTPQKVTLSCTSP